MSRLLLYKNKYFIATTTPVGNKQTTIDFRTCLRSRKKTMILMILMIAMIVSVTTVRKNHENHGNLGQKITNYKIINRFLAKLYEMHLLQRTHILGKMQPMKQYLPVLDRLD